MSDEMLYRVRLRQAQSCRTPFGVRLVKGRDLILPEGHSHLVYYRRNNNVFDVRSVDEIPTNKLPRSVVRRRRKEVKTTYHGTIGENPVVEVLVDEPEAPPAPPVEEPAPAPKPEPEPDQSEPTVTTSTTIYTETQLRKLKRSDLVEIAEEFEIDVADKDLKREIVEKILAADGE